MTRYIFYPGCSMEASAKAYQDSLTAIAGPLGIELDEVDDWNCCGATEYMSISRTPAFALIGRNLALAANQANGTKKVVASCSACYLNLSKADYLMREQASLRDNVNDALQAGGLSYQPGSVEIHHLLGVIVNDIGLKKVKENVVRPLNGLRVAPYLGCMVPRPDYDHRWSDPEHPSELIRLLSALGAEVVDYPLQTYCCGGHMPHISPNTAYEIIRRLLLTAEDARADVMATVCPMCQLNLDAYQPDVNRMFHTHYSLPVLFFTQLIALAFGVDEKHLGFSSGMVNPRPAIEKGLASAAAAGPAPQKAKKGKTAGLPMPVMPGAEEVSE
jgi:heterodisulfide reductase subunit B2